MKWNDSIQPGPIGHGVHFSSLQSILSNSMGTTSNNLWVVNAWSHQYVNIDCLVLLIASTRVVIVQLPFVISILLSLIPIFYSLTTDGKILPSICWHWLQILFEALRVLTLGILLLLLFLLRVGLGHPVHLGTYMIMFHSIDSHRNLCIQTVPPSQGVQGDSRSIVVSFATGRFPCCWSPLSSAIQSGLN
jgi:hypothetical protein